MEGIKKNAIYCTKCGTVIESEGVHDFETCKCKSVAVDGGKFYLKRSGDCWIDVSETWSSQFNEGDWVYFPPSGTLAQLAGNQMVKLTNQKSEVANVATFARVRHYLMCMNATDMAMFIDKYLKNLSKEEIKSVLDARLTSDLHDYFEEGK